LESINLEDYHRLFKILKKFDKSYVRFFGKVKDTNTIRQVTITDLLYLKGEQSPILIIGEKDNVNLKIEFSPTDLSVLIYVYECEILIEQYELLDFYFEFPFEKQVITRGWEPTDEIVYTSNSPNTLISIEERVFYKEIRNQVNSYGGKNIKIWLSVFDESSEEVKERLHGNVTNELKLKKYFIEGIINRDEDFSITTLEGKVSISYHAYIGAPMVLSYYKDLQLMVSDIYIEIEGIIIKPKNLVPNSEFNWSSI
jgi:hypothetical protein